MISNAILAVRLSHLKIFNTPLVTRIFAESPSSSKEFPGLSAPGFQSITWQRPASRQIVRESVVFPSSDTIAEEGEDRARHKRRSEAAWADRDEVPRASVLWSGIAGSREKGKTNPKANRF